MSGTKRRAEQHEGTVRASHLLVKHRDSRRPSSHREKVVTRSKVRATYPHCAGPLASGAVRCQQQSQEQLPVRALTALLADAWNATQ